jgi:orotidine-5'-phosphate decarboxylase
MKVGMELYYAHGPRAVEFMANKGFPVFLDLKLHDIPTTVGKAMGNLLALPIAMVNVHAAGGPAMLAAAHAARAGKHVRLIGVTQLTSTDEVMLRDELLIDRPMDEVVATYAHMCLRAGLDGVVCSPREARLVKEHTSANFLTITPGVRPRGSAANDQIRTMTPNEALTNGADHLVVGRPITAAADPLRAFNELFQE